MAHHQSSVDWKHLAVYGLIVAAVIIVGGFAIWTFIQRQSLVIAPEPLPKVTVVTADPNSKTAAAWVRLLTRAELNATLVELENFNPIEGVVVFCEIPHIPEKLAAILDEFVRRGGALAFTGKPPAAQFGAFQIETEAGEADKMIRVSDTASPLLARVRPGATISSQKASVEFLKETPRMMIDARWAENARAVLMRMEVDRGRYLWFGFDAAAIDSSDAELMLILRSAFRWISGQPVSEGAVGSPPAAKTLSPSARREAREKNFAFSVDRAAKEGLFTVRMVNRGTVRISNPTVKVWLPPDVTKVTLGGDWIMKRNATLTGVPEEGACLVSLLGLDKNEGRTLKLEIAETKPPERPALPATP